MLKRNLFRIISICFVACLMYCSDSSEDTRKTPRDQGEFSFWIVGSGGTEERFGTYPYQTLDSLRNVTDKLDDFLYTIAKEPLTTEEIMKRSGLSKAYVDGFIEALESCRIVKKYDLDKWAATIPFITDDQMRIIRNDLAPMAADVAEYLKDEAEKLRELYEEVKLPVDPPWEDVAHLFMDKFIIDGSFHSNFNRLRRESGKSNVVVIPAFLLQEGENFVNFGCNWYKFNEDDDQREIYVLHGAVMDRYNISMNRYRRNKIFSSGLFKASPTGNVQNLTGEELATLKDLDWLSGDQLLVPIIKAETIKSLQEEFENIGREAAQVAFMRYTDLAESYRRSSYSKFLEYDEDYIQVLIHSIFGLTIEQMIKNGDLPTIPNPVPEYFGVYIVLGKLY